MAGPDIHRMTLFKIAKPEDLDTMINAYKDVVATAVKDGKPYIKHTYAGKTIEDSRNQGYNLAIKMCFASREDMDYYDQECQAHKNLKAIAKGKVEPPLTVFYDALVSHEL